MRTAERGTIFLASLTPHLADILLPVPDALEPVVGGDALLLLLDVGALARVEEDDVTLGLTIEPTIDHQGSIVEDSTVPKSGNMQVIYYVIANLSDQNLSKSAEKSEVGSVSCRETHWSH